MDQYSELKRQMLAVFEEANWLRADKVAEQLNFYPQRSAWAYLKRLWRLGLLNRRSIGQDTLEYCINDAGLGHLRWLRAQRSATNPVIACPSLRRV